MENILEKRIEELKDSYSLIKSFINSNIYKRYSEIEDAEESLHNLSIELKSLQKLNKELKELYS